MRDRTRAVIDSLRTGLWAIPAFCVAAALLLALILVRVDRSVESEGILGFDAGAAGAREVLSAITTSMITFTGLVFSITIVVLQLTSSQFSPRVLRTFLRDWQTQFSLGVFVATFVYSLTVLRTVDDSAGDRFVPAIATTVAFLLLLASIVMFISYIHHITQAIQVSSIMAVIRAEAAETIERCIPKEPEPAPTLRSDTTLDAVSETLTARSAGVLTLVDVARLVALARDADVVLSSKVQVGDYVPEGAPVLQVHGPALRLDGDAAVACLRLERERTMAQDVAFGIRQLVDIAERALSPGVNDPTTAVQALDRIHDLLRRLCTRPFPDGRSTDDDGRVRVVLPVATFADLLDLGIQEIAQYGKDSIQVQRRLEDLRTDLLTVARPEYRASIAAIGA